jgi:rRNA maturation endonuclease Nob1
MRCPYVEYFFECSSINYCDKCCVNPNSYAHNRFFEESKFNYECPACKGKFNNPANSLKSNFYICPFCGEEMKGTNI